MTEVSEIERLFRRHVARDRRHGAPESLALVPIVNEVEDDTPTKAKKKGKDFCLGCRRNCNYSKQFLDVLEAIHWMNKDKSGAWCEDCYTVWRTCYRDELPLSDFATQLETSREYREEFLMRVAGLAALRSVDPSAHARKAQIIEAVQLYRLMSKVLNMPSERCVFVPLPIFNAERATAFADVKEPEPTMLQSLYGVGGGHSAILPVPVSKLKVNTMKLETSHDLFILRN